MTSPPVRRRCRAGGGRVELRGVSRSPTRSGRADAARHRPGRRGRATVALVGATGSGKTTLVPLIPRLYDLDEGSVLVDGADVRDVDLEARCAARSRWSPTTPSCSRPRCARTSPTRAPTPRRGGARRRQRAGLTDFIDGPARRLRHAVGERGLTLSGGQRQRVAIARALLAEPRILILDDATSSVDATTEGEIKRALREVMEGRTTFRDRPPACRRSRWPTRSSCSRRAASRPRHARRAARELGPVPRDRREGPARPGLPHPRRPRSARWRGCERARDRWDRARRARHSQAARLLEPYRGRWRS